MVLIDYPRQSRLKIVGRAEIIEVEKAGNLLAKVRDPHYKAVIERVFVIRIEAFDWNCPQHITPRFTAEQFQEAVAPIERRLHELEQENQRLREAAR
jgi:hypothetical protein